MFTNSPLAAAQKSTTTSRCILDDGEEKKSNESEVRPTELISIADVNLAPSPEQVKSPECFYHDF